MLFNFANYSVKIYSGVEGSHAVMIRSTSSAGRYCGNVDKRHMAIVGMAASKPGAQCPLAIRNRTNMRVAVTTFLAWPLPWRWARAKMKARKLLASSCSGRSSNVVSKSRRMGR